MNTLTTLHQISASLKFSFNNNIEFPRIELEVFNLPETVLESEHVSLPLVSLPIGGLPQHSGTDT